jgi:hypothetical protein
MPAMPLVAGPRPPFGVRPIRSVVQVQLSSCPVSSPSSVRSSGPSSGRGCPAGWCPARPASSRLVSVRPVAAVSSRPPGGGDGDTSVRRAAVTTGSSRVRCGPAPFLAARSTARGGLDAGTAAEVVWRPAGGSVDRGPGPGGARAGGYGRPTRQAGPRRGRPVAGDCARAGSWLARGCRTAPCGRPAGLEPRLLCVVVAEPDDRADRPGRTKRARRRGWRAAPARPRPVASVTGSTPATP